MLAIQLMDTNNACNTDDQITQRADSMDLDDLPSHAAKKVKTTLSEEILATTPIEPLLTQIAPMQNNEKLEPQKSHKAHSYQKKQLHYAKTLRKPQESLQQPDLAQDNQHTNEQNMNIVIDEKNDMIPITDNTKQHRMGTDATSNATIEGTKPDIVRTRVANKSIDLKEEELDATKWNYDTILQAFS
ncbi:27895_t:CDS:2, partial [Gigaspora margarita]